MLDRTIGHTQMAVQEKRPAPKCIPNALQAMRHLYMRQPLKALQKESTEKSTSWIIKQSHAAFQPGKKEIHPGMQSSQGGHA